ncbi:MAG: nucleotide exchange factor GrpE [Clostridiales bacterium]|jgi:molecular chaperone GrpE|nr:nucleotide exchange factor GrpE [Clostridiales bacterium]
MYNNNSNDQYNQQQQNQMSYESLYQQLQSLNEQYRALANNHEVLKSNLDIENQKSMEYQGKIEELQDELGRHKLLVDELSKKHDEKQNLLETERNDFKNHRQRSEEAMNSKLSEGTISAITKVVPIADAVYSAITLIKDEKIKEGVSMIARKFESVFASMGITEIPCTPGDHFNPSFHNALVNEVVDNMKLDEIVLEVLQKGYKLDEKIVRHTSVKVGSYKK